MWDWADLDRLNRPCEISTPVDDEAIRVRRLASWHAAVRRARLHAPAGQDGPAPAAPVVSPPVGTGTAAEPAPAPREPAASPRPEPSTTGGTS
ncbi:hypothetical protein SVIO_081480 [Streptomyces violaceusniger]|uniref:Uncharacterized protein n=1 Tax=Streptomyces violaceusniger TaxID=68280 RepID=A0A4D4L8V2_STRVO|nr:hypothetical protein SVIO_081480 [Streptomyces violaceusniger]